MHQALGGGEASDGELARRVAGAGAGAAEAEGELCRRLAPRVRLYGLRHLRDDAAADDLVQEVLVLTLEPQRRSSRTRRAAPTWPRSRRRLAVREALAGLSETCQDILDRFFAQDQSYRTMAGELDIPAGTIASRIARCLVKLRDQLEGRNEASAGSRR